MRGRGAAPGRGRRRSSERCRSAPDLGIPDRRAQPAGPRARRAVRQRPPPDRRSARPESRRELGAASRAELVRRGLVAVLLRGRFRSASRARARRRGARRRRARLRRGAGGRPTRARGVLGVAAALLRLPLGRDALEPPTPSSSAAASSAARSPPSCAARGQRVTVLERGEPGGEASSAAAGMLSPQSEARTDSALSSTSALESRQPVSRAGRTTLREETGVDVGYRRAGSCAAPSRTTEARDARRASYGWQRRGGPGGRGPVRRGSPRSSTGGSRRRGPAGRSLPRRGRGRSAGPRPRGLALGGAPRRPRPRRSRRSRLPDRARALRGRRDRRRSTSRRARSWTRRAPGRRSTSSCRVSSRCDPVRGQIVALRVEGGRSRHDGLLGGRLSRAAAGRHRAGRLDASSGRLPQGRDRGGRREAHRGAPCALVPAPRGRRSS